MLNPILYLLKLSVVVQWLSCVQLFVTPWIAACQASLTFTVSQNLVKPMSIELIPSNEYSGWISFRIDWFGLVQSKGFIRVFSSTAVQKHQFFGAQPSLWSSSHVHTWLLEKPYLWLSEYIEDWIWVVPGRGVSMINPEKLERWSWPR